jgi:hypothetical protein
MFLLLQEPNYIYIISYFKFNGIIVQKKHVDEKHTLLAKKFKEEVNSPMKSGLEKNQLRKYLMCLLMKSLSFFY